MVLVALLPSSLLLRLLVGLLGGVAPLSAFMLFPSSEHREQMKCGVSCNKKRWMKYKLEMYFIFHLGLIIICEKLFFGKLIFHNKAENMKISNMIDGIGRFVTALFSW